MARPDVEERLEQLPRTSYLLWTATGLLFVFVVPGAIAWWDLHLSWSRCFYADPACSLTFATYLLCLITLAAFLAAFGAARYAAEALAHEQRAALSVQPCRKNHGEKHTPAATLYFTTADSGRALTETQPGAGSFDATKWTCQCFKALGVGRSPLIDVVLTATAFLPDGDNCDGTVYVGSLRSDGAAHLRFWFPPEAQGAVIQWPPAAQHVDGKRLKHFFPERSRKLPPYVQAVDFSAAPPEGPSQEFDDYDVPARPVKRKLWRYLGFGKRDDQ